MKWDGVAQRTQNARFPSKIALHLKKVCYKISLCEYCQRQTRTVFTGLSNRAKMVGAFGGGRPLLPEILAETDQSPSKTPIFNQYLLVSPQP